MSESTSPGAAEAPAPAVGLMTGKPWEVCGLSRSAFYRLVAAGEAPAPIRLPGARPCWRLADLRRWVEGLRPSRRRRKPAARAGDDESTNANA
jgi:predicted DNA-binding transcriptional regulator AlpA